ncbi:MAG: hypothetical protein J0H15_01445 [Xanthomonadales bacterium]|nr:hypothetical protein [Xanthomonadales bacterium]
MRRGDFTAAWAISDRVLRKYPVGPGEAALPRHEQRLWDGRALDGKRVLVHCYHGLGDTLQFVRLLPLLRARCRQLVLWAQPALLGLLDGIAGADRVLPLHDGAPEVERDADVELMELPHILRLGVSEIPPPARFPAVAAWRPRSPARNPLRIGIAWRAGEWNPTRSLPEASLRWLDEVPGIECHSLQYPGRPRPFRAAELACRDLVELARRMRALDAVVSVDSMPAHLAGTLGVPAWILLPEPCDWRWMTVRRDTPWYPRMRLLRQARPGDWARPLAELRAALTAWAGMAGTAPRCPAGMPTAQA